MTQPKPGELGVWVRSQPDPVTGEFLLTIDYAATEDVLYRQFPCTCGATNCRKWITGRRETINATGKAYLAGLASRTVRNLVPRPRRGMR